MQSSATVDSDDQIGRRSARRLSGRDLECAEVSATIMVWSPIRCQRSDGKVRLTTRLRPILFNVGKFKQNRLVCQGNIKSCHGKFVLLDISGKQKGLLFCHSRKIRHLCGEQIYPVNPVETAAMGTLTSVSGSEMREISRMAVKRLFYLIPRSFLATTTRWISLVPS